MLLNQFKHRAIRDLAWVIASPPLVSGFIENTHWWSYDDCLKEFEDCLPALMALDKEPEALIAHLEQLKNMRLGSVFEGLVEYWLFISPNYTMLNNNIQIIEDNHTFGEIDFIIQNIHTQKIIHLEVAVKFYLGSPPYTDAYRWFGTNTRDQLGKKIDHLKTHQTQLSNKHPAHFNISIDEQHCFIKGRLFYPEGIECSPTNAHVAKHHLRGKWSYTDRYQTTQSLIHISKSHWLAELNKEDIQYLKNKDQKELENIDRVECYVNVNNTAQSQSEKQRIFYLPTDFCFPE